MTDSGSGVVETLEETLRKTYGYSQNPIFGISHRETVSVYFLSHGISFFSLFLDKVCIVMITSLLLQKFNYRLYLSQQCL